MTKKQNNINKYLVVYLLEEDSVCVCDKAEEYMDEYQPRNCVIEYSEINSKDDLDEINKIIKQEDFITPTKKNVIITNIIKLPI